MTYCIEHPGSNTLSSLSYVKSTLHFLTPEGTWLWQFPRAFISPYYKGCQPKHALLFKQGPWWGLRQIFENGTTFHYIVDSMSNPRFYTGSVNHFINVFPCRDIE